MAHRRKHSSERGASLIEFAFVAPFLILLLLGIVEFGFIFTEYNEVKHATREGARYAAASNPDRNGDGNINNLDVIAAVCDSMNLPGSTVDIQTTDVVGTGDKGDIASIDVTASIGSLSGLAIIEVFLPSTLSSSVEFRLEQDRAWTPFTTPGAC